MGILRRLLLLLLTATVVFGLMVPLSKPTTFVSRLAGWFGAKTSSVPLPALGHLLDPVRGTYANARSAQIPVAEALTIDELEYPVRVVRDGRGVPHIFARGNRDAVRALGFAVAQDRLFQLDFLPRIAAGRLSEILGADLVEADRFLRSTGMRWGAEHNLERIRKEAGEELEALDAYCEGVNAYLAGMERGALPVEFKILGYEPEPCTPIRPLLLLQYMVYDLTYRTDAADYAELKELMSATEYAKLFPRHAVLGVPIVSELTSSSVFATSPSDGDSPGNETESDSSLSLRGPHGPTGGGLSVAGLLPDWLPAEGYVQGKGSNNWAVSGTRSTTGKPILAGDMHLAVRLPAIWYEAHVVTPEMNVYGVTIPGCPGIIEGFNDHLAWAFTNTGADQIDHYRLTLDESGRNYRYDGAWRPIELRTDSIAVRGARTVVDTLSFSHWGPILRGPSEPISIQWTAHKDSHTLMAVLAMNRARSLEDFQQAIRSWDTPMQNILVATAAGDIAIRSTGYVPIRGGGSGAGVLDGSRPENEWSGRIPFESLPYAENPDTGVLTSTNQEPTGEWYPYYLGHDWRDAYRSVRIDELLSSRERHSVADIASYQSDVHAVQRDLLAPLLDTLAVSDPRADSVRTWLLRWNGETSTDRPEPLILHEFIRLLDSLAWDEFKDLKRPHESVLLHLLRDEPTSEWLDVRSTELNREQAGDLLRLTLRKTAAALERTVGWQPDTWAWGAHHKIRFDHLLESVSAFGRGPFSFPGFEATLSPGAGLMTRHSASWRMVVDLSQHPVRGYGIYPGGQSGNPFSTRYDANLSNYLIFARYPLLRPATEGELAPEDVLSTLDLSPVSETTQAPGSQ